MAGFMAQIPAPFGKICLRDGVGSCVGDPGGRTQVR